MSHRHMTLRHVVEQALIAHAREDFEDNAWIPEREIMMNQLEQMAKEKEEMVKENEDLKTKIQALEEEKAEALQKGQTVAAEEFQALLAETTKAKEELSQTKVQLEAKTKESLAQVSELKRQLEEGKSKATESDKQLRRVRALLDLEKEGRKGDLDRAKSAKAHLESETSRLEAMHKTAKAHLVSEASRLEAIHQKRKGEQDAIIAGYRRQVEQLKWDVEEKDSKIVHLQKTAAIFAEV